MEDEMRATAKDLRFHSKELINTVDRGEEVVITFRGKPCARLVPYQKAANGTEKNELFGMWKDNGCGSFATTKFKLSPWLIISDF